MSTSRALGAIEFINDEGTLYLLVSDGPGTDSGRVLRKDSSGLLWTQLSIHEAGPVLADFVLTDLARKLKET